MSIQETIQRMKDAWSVPRRQTRSDAAEPDFMLSCTFADEPARSDELAVLQGSVPEDLMAFWRLTRTASLFVDLHYGQWGLEILSPSEAVRETHLQRRNRPAQYRDGDVVIGRFLGDSDLLVIRCDEKGADFGKILVALPIDPRPDWFTPADTFGDFLRLYLENEGAKFWEGQ
jgi:hypothetical protein